MAAATWAARTLYAAAKLGLADQLSSGLKSAAEIAAPMHAHAPSLHRLMRTLASLGIDTLLCSKGGFRLARVVPTSSAAPASWKRCWLEQVAINGLTHRGKQHLYSIMSAAGEKIGGHDSCLLRHCDWCLEG